MIEYNKVIRIELDSEIFYDEISTDTKEWWIDYEELEEKPRTLDYLNRFYGHELELLKNNEIDYIALTWNF